MEPAKNLGSGHFQGGKGGLVNMMRPAGFANLHLLKLGYHHLTRTGRQRPYLQV